MSNACQNCSQERERRIAILDIMDQIQMKLTALAETNLILAKRNHALTVENSKLHAKLRHSPRPFLELQPPLIEGVETEDEPVEEIDDGTRELQAGVVGVDQPSVSLPTGE